MPWVGIYLHEFWCLRTMRQAKRILEMDALLQKLKVQCCTCLDGWRWGDKARGYLTTLTNGILAVLTALPIVHGLRLPH